MSTADSNIDTTVIIAVLFRYTILEATNATHLSWKQISNLNGSVIDNRLVVQNSHGPFE
eukprot:m.135400 g.135400  ORF g.135400 m.135400 type:complete len:59 (-) comp13903_c0_seq2:1214-1390(-)